jgi:hypothetical protein
MGLKLVLFNVWILLIALILFAWDAYVLRKSLGTIAPGYWNDWLFLIAWVYIAFAWTKSLQHSRWIA